MIRFFKSPQPAVLFIIPFIVLVLWIHAFFRDSFLLTNTSMPFYNLIASFLNVLPRFLQVLMAVSIVSFEAIYLNDILNRHEVLSKNSYLPALMYALLMSLSLQILQFHPLILVNLLLLRALDKTFMLFKNESPISPLFDSSFLISIASLIYFPAASIFILFLIALAILRSFSIREWLISIIGFSLPYFFLSVYFFWTDQLVTGWKNILLSLVPGQSRFGFTIEKPLLSLFALIGFLLLLATKGVLQHFYKNTVRTRSLQQILLLFLIIAAMASFALKTIPLYQVCMLAIPLAVFTGYYFLEVRRRVWFSEMLLWLMIGLIVWNHL